jgi:hypothetical protein
MRELALDQSDVLCWWVLSGFGDEDTGDRLWRREGR